MTLEQRIAELERKVAALERRPDLLYTIEEVAAILKTNKNTVYKLINKGLLTAMKLGRLKITRFELMRFLRTYNGKDLSDLDNIKDLQYLQSA